MEGQEKRIHSRIQIRTEVRISGPLGVEMGMLRDVSKGGAGVYSPVRLGQEGDEIELFIPISDTEDATIVCELLRLVETPQGVLHGLRFGMIEPILRKKLLTRIEHLLLKTQGGDTRKHPRLARRMNIHLDNEGRLKAMLQNISLGGLAMLTKEPMVLDQEVDVAIPIPGDTSSITVVGKVVYQIKQGDQYKVGLEFAHLSQATHFAILGILQNALSSDKA